MTPGTFWADFFKNIALGVVLGGALAIGLWAVIRATDLWWLYGWGGLYPRLMPHYLVYFVPGFHPWKFGDMRIYETWERAFKDSNGNALVAGDAVASAELQARGAALAA